MSACAAGECDRPVKSKGMCHMHYNRARRAAMPECVVEGCAKTQIARGMCAMHWSRLDRRDSLDPEGMEPHYDDPDEAFAARTERRGECLIWTGAKIKGYGSMRIGTEHVYAHRYAWEREYGPIPDGKHIDHRYHCDKACCEATHLRPATVAQNMANRNGPSGATSGVRNVYLDKRRDAWYVQIKCAGRPYFYGYYDTKEEAVAIAEEKRELLFGEYRGYGVAVDLADYFDEGGR